MPWRLSAKSALPARSIPGEASWNFCAHAPFQCPRSLRVFRAKEIGVCAAPKWPAYAGGNTPPASGTAQAGFRLPTGTER